MSEKIYSSLVSVLLVTLVTACAPSPQAMQTAVAQTQAAWTPTPAPTSTDTPSIASILGTSGFMLAPSYCESTCYCETPCTSYEQMDPWIVAKVYQDDRFEIIGGMEDAEGIYPIITQLYGQEITSWIAVNLPILLQEKENRTGLVGNYTVEMSEIREMDNSIRFSITITPKQ